MTKKKFGSSSNQVQQGSKIFDFAWTQTRTCGPVQPIRPNLGLNFGQVQKSSGSNFGSELNYGSPTW